jgi:hypothetical protein
VHAIVVHKVEELGAADLALDVVVGGDAEQGVEVRLRLLPLLPLLLLPLRQQPGADVVGDVCIGDAAHHVVPLALAHVHQHVGVGGASA